MTRTVRNVEIAGHRTSFRLETPFWEALTVCARQRGMSLDALVSNVVREHRGAKATMSSTVRVFAIKYFHDLAEGGPRHGTV
jgi:predicted DNA-binding ribbon-helix-helix protein